MHAQLEHISEALALEQFTELYDVDSVTVQQIDIAVELHVRRAGQGRLYTFLQRVAVDSIRHSYTILRCEGGNDSKE